MFGSWFNVMMLALESQQVIALRLAKVSFGGIEAWREGQLMLSEKVAAGQAAGSRLACGASANAIVTDYRRTVRANVVRLSKG